MVIIWLNGAFGAGKTTLAAELHRRLPDAVVYNPEDVGLALWKWLPVPEHGECLAGARNPSRGFHDVHEPSAPALVIFLGQGQPRYRVASVSTKGSSMVQLGRTGLEVFPLVLGGNTFGWTSDEVSSHHVLDAFVAGGGNFIDTADSYNAFVPGNSGGESETIIGSWLATRKNRDSMVIGTKVSQHPKFRGLSAANVAAAADASLTRLGTDYIDVYYAHFDDPKTPLAETAGAFDALRKAGKIRAVALSNYTGTRIAEWLDICGREGYEPPAVLQPHYNLVTRQPYEREVAPLLAAEEIVAVPYFALASGFLTGKYREIGTFRKLGSYFALAGGLLTGKHRRQKQEFRQGIRQLVASRYFSKAGLAVVKVVEDIAAARKVEMATVAIAWLRGRPSVVAPIASARTVEQLPALLASATLELTADETAALDEVSARVG